MINIGNVPFTLLAGPFGGVGPNHRLNVGAITFAFDDDSIVYIADFGPTAGGPLGQPDTCFCIYVIDASGAYTFYMAPSAYVSGVGGYINSIIPLGPGNFLITLSTGSTYHAIVKNQKLNNASPIVLYPGLGFQNSCGPGGALSSAYYDQLKNAIAVAWYKAVGQNGTEIYSSVYGVDAGGNLNQWVDGWTTYACPNCSPAVPDLYDQTSAKNAGYTWAAQCSNGVSIAWASNYPPNTYLSRQTFAINVGATMYGVYNPISGCNNGCTSVLDPQCPVPKCNCSNGNYVTTRINDQLFIPITEGGNNSYAGDSNISGLAIMMSTFQNGGSNLGTVYAAGDNDALFSFIPQRPASGSPNAGAGNVVITPKHIFLMADGGTTSAIWGAIYLAPNPGIYNGYSVNRRGVGLINGVRPISVSGKYKA